MTPQILSFVERYAIMLLSDRTYHFHPPDNKLGKKSFKAGIP